MGILTDYIFLRRFSVFCLIAAVIIGLIAVLLFINIQGGISGIKNRMKKNKASAQSAEKGEVVQDASSHTNKKDISGPHTDEMPDLSDTDDKEETEGSPDTEDQGLLETQAISEDDDSDDTDLLTRSVQRNKFNITRKIVITHDKEGED